MSHKRNTLLRKMPWEFILGMNLEVLQWKTGERRLYQALEKEWPKIWMTIAYWGEKRNPTSFKQRIIYGPSLGLKSVLRTRNQIVDSFNSSWTSRVKDFDLGYSSNWVNLAKLCGSSNYVYVLSESRWVKRLYYMVCQG